MPKARVGTLVEPAVATVSFAGESAALAATEPTHAIRGLGGAVSSGSTLIAKGATASFGTPPHGMALELDQSEVIAGLRMDSIDEEWDIEPPDVTTEVKARSAPVPSSSSSSPSPGETSSGAGRFASPERAASKVQQAADAFRQRATVKTGNGNGAQSDSPKAKSSVSKSLTPLPFVPAKPASDAVSRATPPVAKTESAKTESAKTETAKTETAKTETAKTETVDTTTASLSPADSPSIVPAPVVAIDEPLELNEMSADELPPPLPPEATAPTSESKAKPESSSSEAATNATAPEIEPAHRGRTTTLTTEGGLSFTTASGERLSESHLSLDTAYAVEFFSSAPPPAHVEVEMEHELLQELHRVRTPDQVARQLYLRRIVSRVMLGVLVFVVGVVYILWNRGMLHFAQ